MVKQYAQACHETQDGTLPQEVAMAIYYNAIAVALLRHNRRITSLSDEVLLRGFQWLFQQAWVDEGTRARASEAVGILT